MSLLDKTLLYSYPSIARCLTAEVGRYGIILAEQKLLEIVNGIGWQYERIADKLCDFQTKSIMESAGLYNSAICGSYALKRKNRTTWAILNENRQKILAGSLERILNALEKHQEEMGKRNVAEKEAEKTAQWAAFRTSWLLSKGKMRRSNNNFSKRSLPGWRLFQPYTGLCLRHIHLFSTYEAALSRTSCAPCACTTRRPPVQSPLPRIPLNRPVPFVKVNRPLNVDRPSGIAVVNAWYLAKILEPSLNVILLYPQKGPVP